MSDRDASTALRIWETLARALDPAALLAEPKGVRGGAKPAKSRVRRVLEVVGALVLMVLVAVLCVSAGRWLNLEGAALKRVFAIGLLASMFGTVIGVALPTADPRPEHRLRRRRVEVLKKPEVAVAHLGANASVHPVDIENELRRRRVYWRARVDQRHVWDSVSFAHSCFWWMGLMPLTTMTPAFIRYVEFDRYVYGPVAAVMVLSPLLALVTAPVLAGRRLRRLSASLTERVCPDCGYSLLETADAVVPGVGPVNGLGPERCNECGSRWPLVPPPAGSKAVKP